MDILAGRFFVVDGFDGYFGWCFGHNLSPEYSFAISGRSQFY
jgi:hypothetical protein